MIKKIKFDSSTPQCFPKDHELFGKAKCRHWNMTLKYIGFYHKLIHTIISIKNETLCFFHFKFMPCHVKGIGMWSTKPLKVSMDHVRFTIQFDYKFTISFSHHIRINLLIFFTNSTIFQIQMEGHAKVQHKFYLGNFLKIQLVEFGIMGSLNIPNKSSYTYQFNFMVLAFQPDPHIASSICITSQVFDCKGYNKSQPIIFPPHFLINLLPS